MIKVSSLLLIAFLTRFGDGAPTSGNSSSTDASVTTSFTEALLSTAVPTSTDTSFEETTTAGFISTDPNNVLWNETSDPSVVTPQRGTLGAPILGPDNIPIDLQNPDLFAPPTTDSGLTSVKLISHFRFIFLTRRSRRTVPMPNGLSPLAITVYKRGGGLAKRTVSYISFFSLQMTRD